jgi:hypothetical protein
MWWFGDCTATIGSFVPSKLVFLPEMVSLRFGLDLASRVMMMVDHTV